MENNERKYIGDICYIQLHSGGVLTRIADGMSVKLSATEYKILSYFIANKNQDLSLMQIANFIWGSGHEKDADSIKSQITHIRSKLNQIQPGLGKKCIVTNRGFNTYTLRLDPKFTIAAASGIDQADSAEPAQDGGEKREIEKPIDGTEIPITFNDFGIHGAVFYIGTGNTAEEDSGEVDDDFLLDEEIEQHFSHPIKEEKSPLEKKLEALKGRKFTSSLKPKPKDASAVFNPSDVVLCGGISGKQFTIRNLPGVTFVFFEVYSVYDYQTQSRYLSLRQLDSLNSEDNSYTTFFWDTPNLHYMLVFLSFQKDDAGGYEVYINNAILMKDEMKILKQPTLFRFKSWYLPSALELNGVTYDVDNMPEEVRQKILEETLPQEAEWVDTDLRNTPAVVIDPDNVTPILREVYFDEEEQELKARVQIVPYKGYFIFRVYDDIADSSCAPLKDVELGHLYRAGIHGFPKDLLLAIRHLERDGSPNSIYQIAGIFATEEELRDDDMYLEYLQKAADMGAESAIAELAEYHCRKCDSGLVGKAKELFQKIAGSESTVGNFLFACCMENGLLGSADPETIFDCYFKAACNEFQPALARLKCKYSDLENPDVLYAYFLDSLESGTSNVDYCLGCTYFYGYGLYPRKQEGLKLLLEAAERRDKQAIYAVFDIYDKDSEYQDKNKALKWLMEIEKFDPTVQNNLAMRLLDGEGCDCSEENDAVAFSLLEHAANSGSKSAINNLGWMYKKGRGCQIDYAKALELFEESGIASSFYHMGDMYENGLGVSAELEKAIAFYETASRKGNKKAKKTVG